MKYLIILASLVTSNAWSQNNMDKVLEAISNNNKSIIAHNQLLEAQRLSHKTGLYLDNPTLEYDYMKGSPANAGNQTDITVIQSFDFPTVYRRRKNLSNARIDQLALHDKSYQQEILLEAKLVYLELVYLNQYLHQLNRRKSNAEQLMKALQHKYEKGSATILDVNKGKMNFQFSLNKWRLTESKRAALNQKLTELNGGIDLQVTDSIYPITETLPLLDSLIRDAAAGDYKLQAIQQEQEISRKNEQLNRALTFPKLEGGYRYQAILGQKFNGFHAGIRIPLFENKNKVREVKQQTLYYELLQESHKNEHHSELEALYNMLSALRLSEEEYRMLLNETHNETLLKKSLDIGEISTIEYFTELSYYYEVYDQYLTIQRDYFLKLTEIEKYKL